jgi:hypothetical protein
MRFRAGAAFGGIRRQRTHTLNDVSAIFLLTPDTHNCACAIKDRLLAKSVIKKSEFPTAARVPSERLGKNTIGPTSIFLYFTRSRGHPDHPIRSP